MKVDSRGFSLTELIVVIAIMSTLLAIVTINFSAWQKKYNIENQAKEMMVDLNDLRVQAIQTKSNHMAVLSVDPKVMAFRSYTTEEPVTLTTGKEVLRKNLKYPISSNASSLASCSDMVFNSRGYTFDGQTIYIQPVGTGAVTDCLVISNARINLGQNNGTDCIFK